MKKYINTNTHSEVINCVLTDYEIKLLENFHLKIFEFLDQEDKLGILEQSVIDKIDEVDNLLQDLLIPKNNTTPKAKKETLSTLPFDADEGGFDLNLKRNKIQLEL